MAQPLLQILRRPPAVPLETCEFCGAAMAAEHGHLVDLPRRVILCVCRPCYLLFTHDGAGGARFRAIPQRYALVPEFAAADEQWNTLDLPIGLAFFFRNSLTGRTTAFYPSPAGATESELPLDAWDSLVSAAPLLATMADDVEAFLIRRQLPSPQAGTTARAGVDALVVPIDVCYELVGRIRRGWRGIQGGDDLWHDIDEFFEHVTRRADAERTR
ncbi:MAG TPA: DUF5947 family protein [Vicinamibacterales bacterium]|nr:DUF5947 family protein [Vicinamibacterales bacterium]